VALVLPRSPRVDTRIAPPDRSLDKKTCSAIAECFLTAFCDRLIALCSDDLLDPATTYGYHAQVKRVIRDLRCVSQAPVLPAEDFDQLATYHALMVHTLQTATRLMTHLESAGQVRLALEWVATAPQRVANSIER